MIEFIKSNARWLLAGMLLTFTSSFGQTYFISLFAGEIQNTFSLSHGGWASIYLIGTLASAIVMIWAGGLADVFRVRVLGPAILILLVISCLFMAVLPVVWLLPIIIFLLRFGGQGMATHIGAVSMSRWFVANRGKALSIAGLGFSIGEACLPLIFVGLMTLIYWQNLWFVAAGLCLIAIPALMWCLTEERSPNSQAQDQQSLGMNLLHWTRGLAITHWLFWMMIPAIIGQSAFNTAFFFHQVYFAETNTWTHLSFVALIPVYTCVSIGAMILSGMLLDRFGTAKLIPFFQLPMVVGFLCFATAQSLGGVAIGLFFIGLSSGANATLPNAFWAEFYGTKHLGAIKSAAAAAMVFGSAIGPYITGISIDSGIPLTTQYVWVSGYFIISSLCIWVGIRWASPLLSTAS